MRERKRRFRAALLGLLMLCALAQPALAGTITNSGTFQFGDGASMENGGSFVNGTNGVVRGSGTITINPGGSFSNRNSSLGTNGSFPSIVNRAGANGVTGLSEQLSGRITTQYTVTLDPNGGSFGSGTESSLFVADDARFDSYLYLNNEPVSKYTPTRAGYRFKGWFTTADADSQNDDTRPGYANGNTTLYAGWAPVVTLTLTVPNGFTATVNGNTAAGTAVTVNAGEQLDVELTLANGWWLPDNTATLAGTMGTVGGSSAQIGFAKQQGGSVWKFTESGGISENTTIAVTASAYFVADGSNITVANALGSNSKVYFNGTETLTADVTVADGKELYIASGAMLVIRADKMLFIQNGATLTNNGTINNYGAVIGTVTGTQPVRCENGRVYALAVKASEIATKLGTSDVNYVYYNGSGTNDDLASGFTVADGKVLWVANSGHLSIPAEQTLQVGGSIKNDGTIEVKGSGNLTVSSFGQLANNSTGTIANDGTITTQGNNGKGIYNYGTFTNSGNGKVDGSGSLVNCDSSKSPAVLGTLNGKQAYSDFSEAATEYGQTGGVGEIGNWLWANGFRCNKVHLYDSSTSPGDVEITPTAP